jgi:hypothetical protein
MVLCCLRVVCLRYLGCFLPVFFMTLQTDWERDAKGENTMGYRQFFDSFFELADIWCPDIDGGQYAHFLDTLRLRLTVVTVHKKDGTIVRKTVHTSLIFYFLLVFY